MSRGLVDASGCLGDFRSSCSPDHDEEIEQEVGKPEPTQARDTKNQPVANGQIAVEDMIPPGGVTLWRLPANIEEEFDARLNL
jgi:hypothetical protein